MLVKILKILRLKYINNNIKSYFVVVYFGNANQENCPFQIKLLQTKLKTSKFIKNYLQYFAIVWQSWRTNNLEKIDMNETYARYNIMTSYVKCNNTVKKRKDY